ncbi:CAP domain protein [Akanthomyces lecanii RCEF 1005]|uniref:CAP domain protein n=1 Tax=Akanthomyces lecanii RCEF 1005 TaxID=1081108 RepID=A0A168G4W4_CORDF|nr:CAP domain protein [Akanthomyces lecanii RCEF 1005]
MIADVFFKAAVLALAAVASASPVSVEARDIEAREHDDFKNQMLAAHNWYRGQHSAAPLQWDNNLANNAHAWAARCSENPRHQPNDPHGENIAWGGGWSSSYGWANLWGHERTQYNFNQPGFNGNTGHFTQLVWKSTKRVGCGWAKCAYGNNVVCEYDPAGNIVGNNNKYFKDNVGRQTKGNPNDQYHP